MGRSPGLLAHGSSASGSFPNAQPLSGSLTFSGCCPRRPRSQWRGPRGILTRFPRRASVVKERYEPRTLRGAARDCQAAYRWLNVMKLETLVLTVAIVGLTGCAADYCPIPDGTYRAQGSEEAIVARGSQLAVHIWLDHRGTEPYFRDHSYGYTVHDDGELQPYTSTTGDEMDGIGYFDWRWDGKAIVQRDPIRGTLKRFERQEPFR